MALARAVPVRAAFVQASDNRSDLWGNLFVAPQKSGWLMKRSSSSVAAGLKRRWMVLTKERQVGRRAHSKSALMICAWRALVCWASRRVKYCRGNCVHLRRVRACLLAQLFYFETERATEPLGFIDLSGVTVSVNDNTIVLRYAAQPTTRGFVAAFFFSRVISAARRFTFTTSARVLPFSPPPPKAGCRAQARQVGPVPGQKGAQARDEYQSDASGEFCAACLLCPCEASTPRTTTTTAAAPSDPIPPIAATQTPRSSLRRPELAVFLAGAAVALGNHSAGVRRRVRQAHCGGPGGWGPALQPAAPALGSGSAGASAQHTRSLVRAGVSPAAAMLAE